MSTGGIREESLPSVSKMENDLTAQMKDVPPATFTLNEANLASLAHDKKKNGIGGTQGFVQVDILEPVK